MNELGPKPPPRHRQLGALLSAQAPPVGPRLAGEPERPSIAWLSRRDRLVVLVGLTGIVGAVNLGARTTSMKRWLYLSRIAE